MDLPEAEATEEDREFLSWLRENGATFPKLMWPVYRWPGQPHDGERGVLVTEDIEPGECMFTIPCAVLLNREKCLSSAIGQSGPYHLPEPKSVSRLEVNCSVHQFRSHHR